MYFNRDSCQNLTVMAAKVGVKAMIRADLRECRGIA
jgi:hypothetical protein